MSDEIKTENIVDRQDWRADCKKWYSRILTGKYSHWCYEWDGLPIDETCLEFSVCHCFEKDGNPEEVQAIQSRLRSGKTDKSQDPPLHDLHNQHRD